MQARKQQKLRNAYGEAGMSKLSKQSKEKQSKAKQRRRAFFTDTHICKHLFDSAALLPCKVVVFGHRRRT